MRSDAERRGNRTCSTSRGAGIRSRRQYMPSHLSQPSHSLRMENEAESCRRAQNTLYVAPGYGSSSVQRSVVHAPIHAFQWSRDGLWMGQCITDNRQSSSEIHDRTGCYLCYATNRNTQLRDSSSKRRALWTVPLGDSNQGYEK